MSEPMHYKGYVEVRAVPGVGMITLRADLSDAKVGKALKSAVGVAMPEIRGISGTKTKVAWMAPDEALVICDDAEAASLAAALRDGLGDVHALVHVVSDARAVFDVVGARADEVLAKLAPVDMAALKDGQMRRTRLGQVAVAIWRTDDGLRLICFRSVAQYVFDALCIVARPGSEVFPA